MTKSIVDSMAEDNLKHKTKVGIYWTFLNQGATQLMQFVVGIVMARLLSPSDFGITALPAVFMAVANSLIDGGFSAALIRKPEVTQKDLTTSFYYSIIVGVFCYFCMYLSAPFIADFYETPILTPLIRVTCLSFLWGPLMTPQSVILNRKLDFKTQAYISIINKIISGVIGISVAYAGYGIWALVYAGLSASFFSLLQTWLAVKWLPSGKWDKESFKYLWNFGNKMIGTNLIEAIYNNITPIFIGKYYSTVDLGHYNRALGYAQLPSGQISSVVQKVTFPSLSKLQDDNDKLSSAYRRLLRSISFVVFPIMFMLGALAEPFVVGLITDKWLPCVPYLRLMCIWWCWVPIHQINVNLLMVKGKSDLVFRLTLVKRAIALTIMCITLPMGILPFLIGSIFNSLLVLVINTYYTGKLINVGFFVQMKDLTPILILSTLIAVGVYFVSLYFNNVALQIIISGSLGLILYILIAMVLKFPELEDVKYMISKK